MYDMLCFEPEKAHESYYTLDDTDIVPLLAASLLAIQRSIENGKAEALQGTQNADKELASEADWKKAHEMIQRLKDCGLYDKRFAGGKYQVEFNVDIDGVPSRDSSTAYRMTASLTPSPHARSTSSGTTSTAGAMTFKHTYILRSLTYLISTGWYRRRLTPSTLQM